MGFFSFLFGKKRKQKQIPRYTPAQEAALNQLLSRGLANTDTTALEAQYRKSFEQDTVPQLAERFTAMGGQSGSGFEDALRRGALDLEGQMAGLKFQGGQQALGQGLMQRHDTVMQPGSPGFLQQAIAPALGNLLTGGLSSLFGLGGSGAAGGLGSLLGGAAAQQQKTSPIGGAGNIQYFPGQPQGYRSGGGRTPSYWDTMFGSGF